MPRRSPEKLRLLLTDVGFWPAARDASSLLDHLADDDAKVARGAERALMRLAGQNVNVAGTALQQFAEADVHARRAIVALIGELARTRPDPQLPNWLSERLAEVDGPTRRRAISALGKLGKSSEKPLLAAWQKTEDPADRRAIAQALGRVDSKDARRALDDAALVPHDDALLMLRVSDAQLRGRRHVAREQPSRLRGERAVPVNTRILLHVRAGLEPLLIDELTALDWRFEAQPIGPGRVRVVWQGPIGDLFSARTFLHMGFPLPPEPVASSAEEAVIESVVRSIASPTARAIFASLTEGPLRYRLGWTDGAKHKVATRNVATALAQVFPEAVNDPIDAPWHVYASVRGSSENQRVFVELWPRALPDPRFDYRKIALPASSHPTVAAAIARVAGIRTNDVVWDPFVGAGTELIERARLGPFRKLVGTDIDPRALEAAKENIAAAGLAEVTLSEADARTFTLSEKPTLLITNPPFGRRVPVAAGASHLIEEVLTNAARQLAPHGRMVLVMPRRIDPIALCARLKRKLSTNIDVDLGGIAATLARIE